MEDNKSFIVSEENWSLHRKGYEDQVRHQEKVNEALKKQMADLVTDESIIMSRGQDIIKIPIKSLDEYKIRYNYSKNKHVGSGNGDSQIGDIVARGPGGNQDKSPGEGEGGGESIGEDWYEAEISLEELKQEFFSELELPNLQQKQSGDMHSDSYEFNDIGRIGIMGNIHKKRTLMAAFKRNALDGKSKFYPVMQEDLRFRTWNEAKKPDTGALIIAMMDVSGSMGIWEKYMARSFFFWTQKFLETKYEKVKIEFISHHTEAKVVSEEDFYSRGESGGTICSSAHRKALQLIEEKYPPEQYNIYTFQASDGDNLTSDNARCVKLVEKLMEISNMFGYIEVNQYNRHSTLMNAYKNIKNPKFKNYVMRSKSDVYHSLKHMFRKEEEHAKL